MQTSREELRAIIEGFGSKLFSVTFIKKDGSERTMQCHYRVTRDIKGDANEERYRRAQATRKETHPELINVVDVSQEAKKRNEGRRSVNLDTIVSIRGGGREYIVNEWGAVA